MLRSLLFVTLPLVCSVDLLAQRQFRTTRHLGPQGVSHNHCAGDVDGDGDIDIVTSHDHSPNRLWLNDGRGGFAEATAGRLTTPTRNATYAVDLVDIDSDGDLDLLVVNDDDMPNRVHVNDGRGIFTDVSATALPPNARWSVDQIVFDCDGDGDVDWFVVESGRPSLYLNNGVGVFTDVSTTQLPATAVGDGGSSSAVDIDSDGDLDVLLSSGATTRILRNNGVGVFSLAPTNFLPVNRGGRHAVGDVDGDGDADLFLDYSRVLLVQQSPGTFVDVSASALPMLSLGPVDALVDVDGDGFPDLVGRDRLWLNDGRGRFVIASHRAPPLELVDFLAADFDGDGDLDLLSRNGRLYTNFLAQVDAPGEPRLGATYSVDLHVRPGFLGVFPPAFVAPFVAFGGATIPFPPLGTVRIDPTTAIALPLVTLAGPAGAARLQYPIPNDPTLVGLELHHQALVADHGRPVFLSNAVADQIR